MIRGGAGKFFSRCLLKIEPMSAMNMEIDKPGAKLRFRASISSFVETRLSWPMPVVVPDFEADPSVIQDLIFEDYAGIVNARRAIALSLE